MTRNKSDKYDNAKFNHNKNVQMKSDRLHFIANKSEGENAMLAKKIVELYDTRQISQSDKIEDLLWELRFSNGKVIKKKS